MDVKVGMVVKSAAGRDKGRFMAVISVGDGFAYIADGDVRKAETPKKKKLKHLKPTNTFIPENNLTNKYLRAFFRSYPHEVIS
jgi:ribosomal protein L14E/L6E/L27E